MDQSPTLYIDDNGREVGEAADFFYWDGNHLDYTGPIPTTNQQASAISIAKWQLIEEKLRACTDQYQIIRGIGPATCGFCMLYYNSFDESCNSCPIKKHTGEPFCNTTPYADFEDECQLVQSRTTILQAIAIREIDFLFSIADNMDNLK